MVGKKARTIEITADTEREFFLIHGYTGSPMDFNRLPHYLNKEFDAHVKILLLKGHGTHIEDLDHISYDDLLEQIEDELKKDLRKGRKVIVGGISFGALVALDLASRYPVKGVFSVCPPYILKFPFNVKGVGALGKFKKYWKKMTTFDEDADRRVSYAYDHMHVRGLQIVKEANAALKKGLHNITCPVLNIHSCVDPIGKHRSSDVIQNSIRSSVKETVKINTKIHNMFFSTENNDVYKKIVGFIEHNHVFDQKNNDRVAAVIPSFNEAERIGGVLEVVTMSKIIDEIIVVDDGSDDTTEEIVKTFKNVVYLKNEHNVGKAESMKRGVSATDAGIIFFCDADLIGFSPDIVSGIVEPVKSGSVNMFIGLRGNFMQKGVHLFAINSGERALRRVVWEKLPEYFKYKYRVEAGLNYFVRMYFGGFEYKQFDYSQPTKERKYGFVKGTYLRWGMNIDVLYAYVRDIVGRW